MSCWLRVAVVVVAFCASVALGQLSIGNVHRGDSAMSQFYGTDNTEGRMEFECRILIDTPEGLKLARRLLARPQYAAGLNKLVHKQLKHMMGAFINQPEFADAQGVPELGGEVEFLKAKFRSKKRQVMVTYKYTDKAVFHKGILSNKPRTIAFWLPLDPLNVYKVNDDGTPQQNFVKCTDEHYQSATDFWYFWNPTAPGCPIRKRRLVRVTARLTPLQQTRLTFPEYDIMYRIAERASDVAHTVDGALTVKVTILAGVDRTKHSETDKGVEAWHETVSFFLDNGFEVVHETADLRRVRSVEPFEDIKTGDLHYAEIDIVLTDPYDDEFVTDVVTAIENQDIIIYAGHSGLGGHVNVQRMQRVLKRDIRMPLDKYQIIYFHGCSTYSYYNRQYFELKQSDSDPLGTRMLDIVTTGVGSVFHTGPFIDFKMVYQLVSGKRFSWQKIVDTVYRLDKRFSALTHVNGDEDNPTHKI
eukprot:m.23782 g.23782  ORF g.23782 m.23782 type:complete len:472 (+) comp7290_c0_seq1:104-1519(+)